ncbi:hypothetical protein F5Y09DRAFT_307671 [Xylaria sp. FL1042]|nr:hypothetical protein F5Y09DRAFT_307671 [Xylaria sp. FL1042]
MRIASMLFAVLQSAVFHTLNYILSDYLSTDRFQDLVEQDPVYRDFATEHRRQAAVLRAEYQAPEMLTTTIPGSGETRTPVPVHDEIEGVISVQPTIEVPNSVKHLNGSAGSETENEIKSTGKADWRTNSLKWLRVFVTQIILGPLLYSWHIWLERLFPSRRSAQYQSQDYSAYQAIKKTEPDTVGADDIREEQVIQRWLQQGKIRRASLSWGNTFAKWVIQWTIGRYWMDNAEFMLEAILRLEQPWKSALGPIKYYLFYWPSQRLFLAPFATISAFILVPASKRLPFISGVTLLWRAFLYSLLYLLTPWAMKTELVQATLQNMTTDMKSWSHKGAHTIDEL